MRNLNQTITSKSEDETIRFASEFAHTLRRGDVVLFSGDLGMGKSVFCRSIIRSLCGDAEMDVPSPTFTLVQQYDSQKGVMISHFDLYRLETPEDVFELGWDDALAESIVLVEWPERLGGLLPDDAVMVRIEQGADDERIIEVSYHE